MFLFNNIPRCIIFTYSPATQTMDREGGFKAVQDALDAIKTTIESYEGSFRIIMAVSFFEIFVRRI